MLGKNSFALLSIPDESECMIHPPVTKRTRRKQTRIRRDKKTENAKNQDSFGIMNMNESVKYGYVMVLMNFVWKMVLGAMNWLTMKLFVWKHDSSRFSCNCALELMEQRKLINVLQLEMQEWKKMNASKVPCVVLPSSQVNGGKSGSHLLNNESVGPSLPPSGLVGPPIELIAGPPPAIYLTAPTLKLVATEVDSKSSFSKKENISPRPNGLLFSVEELKNVKLRRATFGEAPKAQQTHIAASKAPSLVDILGAQNALKSVVFNNYPTPRAETQPKNEEKGAGIFSLHEISSMKANLKKGDTNRSPGGTPYRTKKDPSPGKHDMLRSALFKKFKSVNILSPPIRG